MQLQNILQTHHQNSNTPQPLGVCKHRIQRNIIDKLKMVQQDLKLKRNNIDIQELKFKPHTFQTNSTNKLLDPAETFAPEEIKRGEKKGKKKKKKRNFMSTDVF